MALTVVVALVVLAVIAAVALLVAYGRRYRQEQQVPPPQPAGGWHGPSASGGFPAVEPAADTEADATGPTVPSQRTGEHDRDRREPAADEHSGPVRALAGRLRRRRG